MKPLLQKYRKNRVEVVGECPGDQKIFVIGLSGTGTRSLHRAFQMLGISSCHYPMHPSDFDTFRALSDVPVTCRYKILDTLYPGAKFIHTVRDMDGWLANRRKKPPDRKEIPFWMKLNRMLTYGTLRFDEPKYIEVFEYWQKDIGDYFANRENNLLVMNIIKGDGWDKLCPFLGARLHRNVPFPKVNRSKHTGK